MVYRLISTLFIAAITAGCTTTLVTPLMLEPHFPNPEKRDIKVHFIINGKGDEATIKEVTSDNVRGLEADMEPIVVNAHEGNHRILFDIWISNPAFNQGAPVSATFAGNGGTNIIDLDQPNATGDFTATFATPESVGGVHYKGDIKFSIRKKLF